MARGKERRRHPRIKNDNLSLKLKVGEFDIITHTLNISASGLYCKTEKELPLMSRVKVALMVPSSNKNTKEDSRTVKIDGVVVREHPVIIDGKIKHYDVAIFFEEPLKKNSELISQYITYHMSPTAIT